MKGKTFASRMFYKLLPEDQLESNIWRILLPKNAYSYEYWIIWFMSISLESNDTYDDTNIYRLWLVLLILGMEMTAWQFV